MKRLAFAFAALCALGLAASFVPPGRATAQPPRGEGGDIEAQYRVALAHKRAGRLDEALTAAREVVARRPNHASAHFTIGSILRQQQHYPEALESFRRVIAIEPNHADGHAMAGAMLARLERCPEAVPELRRATELNGRDAASWGNLGACLRRMRQLEPAIAAYQRGLELNPGDPDLLNNFAVALRQAGRPEAAIATLEAALARAPDDATLNLNLAIAYRSLEQWPEAQRHYERWMAAEPNPRDPGPLFDLGYCYEQTGRRDDAVRVYQRFMSLQRGGEAREHAQERLDALQ